MRYSVLAGLLVFTSCGGATEQFSPSGARPEEDPTSIAPQTPVVSSTDANKPTASQNANLVPPVKGPLDGVYTVVYGIDSNCSPAALPSGVDRSYCSHAGNLGAGYYRCGDGQIPGPYCDPLNSRTCFAVTNPTEPNGYFSPCGYLSDGLKFEAWDITSTSWLNQSGNETFFWQSQATNLGSGAFNQQNANILLTHTKFYGEKTWIVSRTDKLQNFYIHVDDQNNFSGFAFLRPEIVTSTSGKYSCFRILGPPPYFETADGWPTCEYAVPVRGRRNSP